MRAAHWPASTQMYSHASRRRARAARRRRRSAADAAAERQQQRRSAARPPPTIAPPQNRRAYAPRRIAPTASSWCRVGLGVSRFSNEQDQPRCDHHRGRERHRRARGPRRLPAAADERDASSSDAAPSATACAIRSNVAVRPLPEIAREPLREQEPGVARRENRRPRRPARRARVRTPVQPEPAGREPQRRRSRRARSGSTRPTPSTIASSAASRM